jgi:hypothetical protein
MDKPGKMFLSHVFQTRTNRKTLFPQKNHTWRTLGMQFPGYSFFLKSKTQEGSTMWTGVGKLQTEKHSRKCCDITKFSSLIVLQGATRLQRIH